MPDEPVYISTSDIRDFRRCRFRWALKSPLRGNWTAKRPDKNLIAGDFGHKALAEYYRSPDRSAERALEVFEEHRAEVLHRLDALWLFGEIREKVIKELDLTRAALEYYFGWAEEFDEFEVAEVETVGHVVLPVRSPDGREVWFVYKPDGLIHFHGKWMLLEFKTCSKFPPVDTLILDSQYRGYVWAASRDPRFAQRKPSGMLFTFIRKASPAVPEVNSRGQLSRDRRFLASTTLALYREAIRRENLDPRDYEEELSWLQEREGGLGSNAFVLRFALVLDRRSLDVFEERLLGTVREMLNPDVAIYPNDSWYSCSQCEFVEPCQLALSGQDITHLMEAGYEHRPPRYTFEEVSENGSEY